MCGQDVVVLWTVQRRGSNRFHQFRAINRIDVRQSDAMPNFVCHDVSQPQPVVGRVEIVMVTGIENHLAVVGKEVVGQSARGAVNRMSANANVTAYAVDTRRSAGDAA